MENEAVYTRVWVDYEFEKDRLHFQKLIREKIVCWWKNALGPPPII